jgi:hypothetical protein
MGHEPGSTIGVMKRFVLAVAVMGLVVLAPHAFGANASCATFDEANRPATNFDAGDKIIVRGTGFAPNSLVLVSFQQGTRTAEVSHLKTNDLGAFATDPTVSRLPASVDKGSAAIQVLQGSGAASCNIELVSSASSRPGGFGRGFYITWGVLLGIVALGLLFATLRRWQAERLAAEMDSIGWERPDDPDEAPLEIVEVDQDERPILDTELPDDEPEVDVPAPAVAGTSDAVARLQREVRAWKAR